MKRVPLCLSRNGHIIGLPGVFFFCFFYIFLWSSQGASWCTGRLRVLPHKTRPPSANQFNNKACLAKCLSILPAVCPFVQVQVKLIHPHYCFLTGQGDIPAVQPIMRFRLFTLCNYGGTVRSSVEEVHTNVANFLHSITKPTDTFGDELSQIYRIVISGVCVKIYNHTEALNGVLNKKKTPRCHRLLVHALSHQTSAN